MFQTRVEIPLPSPTSSLSCAISSGGIYSLLTKVQPVDDSIIASIIAKRGPYEHHEETGHKLVGYAAVHGVVAAARKCQNRTLATRKSIVFDNRYGGKTIIIKL